MVSFQLLDTGKETTADDPKRGIWYASNHDRCGYWTDDWDALGSFNHIPICPICDSLGMQITAAKWFDGAEKFQIEKPHYVEFLKSRKESCLKGKMKWMESFNAFVKQRE